MNLQLPSRFVILDKAIATLASVGQEVYPDFNVFEVAKPYARGLLAERFPPRALSQRARGEALALALGRPRAAVPGARHPRADARRHVPGAHREPGDRRDRRPHRPGVEPDRGRAHRRSAGCSALPSSACSRRTGRTSSGCTCSRSSASCSRASSGSGSSGASCGTAGSSRAAMSPAGRLRNACHDPLAKDIWRASRGRASVGGMPSAVLVAEPESETREYLGRQLRDDGFDVLGAARRSEALELAERARPDVVLLAELDLCLRLRRGEPGTDVGPERPRDRARAGVGSGGARARARPRRRRRHRPAVRLRGAARAHPRAAAAERGDRRTTCVVAGDLVIDRRTRRVHVRDTAVVLSAKEFELVAKLASEPIGCSRRRSCCARSGASARSGEPARSSRTRRACGRSCASTPDDRFVVNVWGVGYRLLE